MRLDLATWLEVEAYLNTSDGIIIPVGSTEQHGPMGLIGTDALVATSLAEAVAEAGAAYVAPPLAYTPAPFNTGFPGTISVAVPVFAALVNDIITSLAGQGFGHFYFLNGHGANLAPLAGIAGALPNLKIRIRSWWDFDEVNRLRDEFFGDWEGMHATPSEIAITQVAHRMVAPGTASVPPEKLTAAYIKAHAGDRHGPPDDHRQRFPDGRVGSHSALATPACGQALIAAAVTAISEDYRQFCGSA